MEAYNDISDVTIMKRYYGAVSHNNYNRHSSVDTEKGGRGIVWVESWSLQPPSQGDDEIVSIIANTGYSVITGVGKTLVSNRE